jgi:DNA-directed RNA polymerase specialized sigma subunit
MKTYQEEKRMRSLYQLHRRAIETSQAMIDARDDRNETIVQLRQQGVTLRKIGELVGLTHVAVLRIEQAAQKEKDNA